MKIRSAKLASALVLLVVTAQVLPASARTEGGNIATPALDWLNDKLGDWAGAKIAGAGLVVFASGVGVVTGVANAAMQGREVWVSRPGFPNPWSEIPSLKCLHKVGEGLFAVGKVLFWGGVVIQIIDFFAGSEVGADEVPPTVDSNFYLNERYPEMRIRLFNAFITKSKGELLEFYSRLESVLDKTPYHVEQYVMASYINGILADKFKLDRSTQSERLRAIFERNEGNGLNDQLRALVS